MLISFDKQTIEFNVAENRLLAELLPNKVELGLVGVEEVERALNNPIGSDRVENLVNVGDKVCIITSDITRPMPSKVCLPPLIKRLNDAGIPDKDITIVFGLGSHRNHTKDEMIYLVGEEIYNRIECIDSNPEKCKRIGITSSGTHVDILIGLLIVIS